MAYQIAGDSIIGDDSKLLPNIFNLSTINGESLLGSGDVTIESESITKLDSVTVPVATSGVILGSNLSSAPYTNFIISFRSGVETTGFFSSGYTSLRIGNESQFAHSYARYYTNTFQFDTKAIHLTNTSNPGTIKIRRVISGGTTRLFLSYYSSLSMEYSGYVTMSSGTFNDFRFYGYSSQSSSATLKNILANSQFTLYGVS